MTHLNDKILKSFFFHPTTPDEIIEIVKSFSNDKSAGPKIAYQHLYERAVLMLCLSQYHI